MKTKEEYKFEDKKLVKHIIDNYPEKVAEFKAGKQEIFDFLLQEVWREVSKNRTGADVEEMKIYILEVLNK